MNKIRLSYTLIDTWLKGDKDKAIEVYLHIPRPTSAAMERGTMFDKYTKGYVVENKALPPELGGKKMVQPVAPFAMSASYNDLIDLKGEVDVWNSEEFIEVKCAEAMDSAQYLSTLQLPFYFLMAELSFNKVVQYGTVYRFDPAHKKYDTSTLYKTPRVIQKMKDVIDKVGPEMHTYFTDQGII